MIEDYDVLILDCDGVLLDSNEIKSKAQFGVGLINHNRDSAKEFVEYNKNNIGLPRRVRFKHFLSDIKKINSTDTDVDNLIKQYSKICYKQLLQCSLTEGVVPFLESISPRTKLYVVSGAEEIDLRHLLDGKGLGRYFEGIYGCPDLKTDIYQRLKAEGEIEGKVLCIGDSIYDYESSLTIESDFVFMSRYSQVENWETYFEQKDCQTVGDLRELK